MESPEKMFLLYGIKDYDMVLAIFDDLTYIKCVDVTAARASKPLLMARRIIKGTSPIPSDPNRPRFSFEIYNKDLIECKICCDAWVIQEVSEYFYSGAWYSDLQIMSPDGIIRQLSVKNLSDKYDLISRNLESVVAYQKYINSFHSYKDWTYFDLSTENEALKKQVILLNSQIEKLMKIMSS